MVNLRNFIELPTECGPRVLSCTFLHQLTPCDRKLVLTSTTKAGVVNPSNEKKVTILSEPYSTVGMLKKLAADTTTDEKLVTLVD